jgi:anti-sigma B factor antagonist
MASSKVSFREIGAVTIVDLGGLLRLGQSSEALRAAIQELANKRQGRILLNFRDVTEIDSAGIGEPVSAYTTVKGIDGQLKLLSPPKKVRDMLKITKLENVIVVYANEEAAVRSFS